VDEAIAAAMERALAVAATARRRTAPNPWVGCTIVDRGLIVGEGATEVPGGRHAEIVALSEAADQARGATAVVTLEPCAHHGRTAPCADALIDAGVTTVVVALEDPDSNVTGQGIARLRDAGIEVHVGLGADLAAEQLAPYLHHRRTGRAYCVAKSALSIDGRSAATDGSSQWITGELARADAHGVRADSQAIVVGAGTAIADQPALTVRDVAPVPREPPLRVLLDARGRVQPKHPLFDAALGPITVITTDAVDPVTADAWLTAGAKVESVPAAPGGIDLAATLALLGNEGVLQACFEGGATVHGALLEADLVDRWVIYVGAALLGADGRPAFTGPGPASIDDAPRLRLVDVCRLGDDVRLDYAPGGR
jgi:diaminohydroxyphosphoribosylaminopyrimidine deaminase/5-amino-6-(5-phosphoribosylamino)uracil reductase